MSWKALPKTVHNALPTTHTASLSSVGKSLTLRYTGRCAIKPRSAGDLHVRQHMPSATSLSTQQIGKLGELLVQYRLLEFAVESAHLTTDAGIDLVAYSSQASGAKTIQVKANLKPKPGGGKGRAALDWWVPVTSPADLFALVDISTKNVWLFTMAELAAHAQQESKGRFHLYMYTDENVKTRKSQPTLLSNFSPFLLEHRVAQLFPKNAA